MPTAQTQYAAERLAFLHPALTASSLAYSWDRCALLGPAAYAKDRVTGSLRPSPPVARLLMPLAAGSIHPNLHNLAHILAHRSWASLPTCCAIPSTSGPTDSESESSHARQLRAILPAHASVPSAVAAPSFHPHSWADPLPGRPPWLPLSQLGAPRLRIGRQMRHNVSPR